MTEADLRAAVLADPADDEVRLVYADWLLERGDPRGEIIQLQIRHPIQIARIAALLAGLPRPAWAARWPPPHVRGFATSIVVTDESTLRKQIAEIVAAHPFATIKLATDQLAVSDDGRWFATISREEGGAGVTLDNYAGWTTTTAIVFDATGRELCRESRTHTEGATGSGDYESGETISQVHFEQGELVLAISDGTTFRRTVP